MKKIFDYVKNFIIIVYILLIIFVTICLLSYNDYRLAVLDNNTLIPVIDEDLEPDYTLGDLLIVEKNRLSTVKEGDVVFFYRTISGEVTVNYAPITGIERVSENEYTFTVEGDYKFSSSNFIGKVETTKIIPKVGEILSILQSKWGFLFLGVFPSLMAFLYTLYTVVLEVQVPDEEDDKNKKKKSNSSKKKTNKDSTAEVNDKKKTPEKIKEENSNKGKTEKTKTNEEKKESKPEKVEKNKHIEKPKEKEVVNEEKQENIEKQENKNLNEPTKKAQNQTEEKKDVVNKTKDINIKPTVENVKKEEIKQQISSQENIKQTEEQRKKAMIEAKMKSMTEEEKKALIKAKLASMTEEEKKALIEAKKKKLEAEKNKK